jgi:hypothetical protein
LQPPQPPQSPWWWNLWLLQLWNRDNQELPQDCSQQAFWQGVSQATCFCTVWQTMRQQVTFSTFGTHTHTVRHAW